MANKKSGKTDQNVTEQDVVAAMKQLGVNLQTISRFKAANPNVDISSLSPEGTEIQAILEKAQARELEKFVTYAKQQGTSMSFDAMEMGVLNAGRKDMQNSLAEIVDSLKFERPVSSEDGEKMDHKGRSKKK